MAQIKKILFPVDFSPACFSAARYLEAFAGRFEAEILLLHVVGMGDGGLTLAEERLPHRQAQLNAFLADELKYFTTERLCVIGDDAATEIVATAQRWHPDLVMMPTHGLGTFRRFFLGSVTAKIWKISTARSGPTYIRTSSCRLKISIAAGFCAVWIWRIAANTFSNGPPRWPRSMRPTWESYMPHPRCRRSWSRSVLKGNSPIQFLNRLKRK